VQGVERGNALLVEGRIPENGILDIRGLDFIGAREVEVRGGLGKGNFVVLRNPSSFIIKLHG